jgi:beta-phosphoglucomutase-like phosphatase (HAD superfamily)
VYQTVMSGMPRHAGARAALEYFGVPDAEGRVREYGDRKQALIQEYIESGDFHAYPDALRFVLAVKDAGLKMATAYSSKNANAFLERASGWTSFARRRARATAL